MSEVIQAAATEAYRRIALANRTVGATRQQYKLAERLTRELIAAEEAEMTEEERYYWAECAHEDDADSLE